MRANFPVTVHLLFFQDNSVLLLRRFHTGYEDGNYSVPAGHLDGNETVRMAAVREAQEEIGVRIDIDDVEFATVMHRKSEDTLLPLSGTSAGTSERVDFFVRIKQWAGEPFNAEPEKCDEISWWDLDGLPENIIPYVATAIKNYREGVPFNEFGWQR